MSKPLGISELVAKIGDENIQVQNIASNMTAGNNGKNQSTLTFATSPEHCSDQMKAAAGVGKPKYVGLLLWIPSEIIDRINQELTA